MKTKQYLQEKKNYNTKKNKKRCTLFFDPTT